MVSRRTVGRINSTVLRKGDSMSSLYKSPLIEMKPLKLTLSSDYGESVRKEVRKEIKFHAKETGAERDRVLHGVMAVWRDATLD